MTYPQPILTRVEVRHYNRIVRNKIRKLRALGFRMKRLSEAMFGTTDEEYAEFVSRFKGE